jgi:hypothetical protein
LRFTLSFRDVEDLLSERGLDISYETVGGTAMSKGIFIAAMYFSNVAADEFNDWYDTSTSLSGSGCRVFLSAYREGTDSSHDEVRRHFEDKELVDLTTSGRLGLTGQKSLTAPAPDAAAPRH